MRAFQLSNTTAKDYAAFMGFEACVTAVSGLFTNVLAFGTVAAVAKAQNRELVFICDAECHNSMFTRALF
jgi:7-keto-8-aminopelargonate synthetase-like enzyme